MPHLVKVWFLSPFRMPANLVVSYLRMEVVMRPILLAMIKPPITVSFPSSHTERSETAMILPTLAYLEQTISHHVVSGLNPAQLQLLHLLKEHCSAAKVMMLHWGPATNRTCLEVPQEALWYLGFIFRMETWSLVWWKHLILQNWHQKADSIK